MSLEPSPRGSPAVARRPYALPSVPSTASRCMSTQPSTRAYRPTFPPDLCARVDDHLRGLGDLRACYLALAILWWLQVREGRDVVAAADVRALYPRGVGRAAGPLGSVTEVLRRFREAGLLASVGDGWYRVTPLGCEVAAALPDCERVGQLRGLGGAARVVRQGRWRPPG